MNDNIKQAEEKDGCLNCKNFAHTVGTFGGVCKLHSGELIAPLYGSPERRIAAKYGLDTCDSWEQKVMPYDKWEKEEI